MKKAVIMAGGFGTRLRPLTINIPKPMVPILNTPMMEHIINLLKKHSINDIIALLYFQPEVISGYFEDGSNYGVKISYVTANADYGTAGSVKNAYQYLDSRFIIISGDVLTDFDLTTALNFHTARNSKATILLTRVSEPLQYGIVITDGSGRITRFLEKPSWGEVFSDTINTGIYILEPEVLDMIPYQEEYDFSKDLFPKMLKNNMPLYGFITDGYWRDIGNLLEYQIGQKDALNSKIKLEYRGIKKYNNIIGKNSKISATAKLSGNVIIGDNSFIGEHCKIRDSVIGNNVIIENGVVLSSVTIWNNVRIGAFSELNDDVICNDVTIGDGATISENVFISDNCSIGSGARLNPNIKLWPNKKIEDGAIISHSLVQEGTGSSELFTDARISGSSNIEINPEFGAKLGAAIGMTFKKNDNLLASRDPDNISRMMKRAIASGLTSVGINVSDLQITSIPQTRQELRTGRYDGGFHVRRSPRESDKTDIIIFNKDGRDISIARAKSIERYFFGEDIKRVASDEVGQINYPERANEIYVNRFLDSLDIEIIKKRKFKILIDYSFGLASGILSSILGRLGVEALSTNDYIDASRFHPGHSEATSENDDICKIMRSLGYELGFRIDPGAEKISLIDERGVWYSHQRLLSIVTKLFLETNRHREPYKIAVSIVSSNEIEEISKDYNVEVLRIKNSHSAMMQATQESQVLFVGGVYGGYIFSDFLFASDGMYSVGKILEMLSKTNFKISQLDEKLPRRFQHQIDVLCPRDSKGTVMRKALEYSENIDRQLVEGVKMFLNDDSVLLVPSKERGAFMVIAESNSYENAINLSKKYSLMINKWIDEG